MSEKYEKIYYDNSCPLLLLKSESGIFYVSFFLRDTRRTPRVLYFIEFCCYDASNKRRLGRTNRIPFVVGRGIFLHKSEPRETIRRPAALAVNQFRREIDGSKLQFCRHSLFFSLSLSLNLSNFLSCFSIFPSLSLSLPFFFSFRCLRDIRSTAKELKFHRRSLFYGRSPDGSKFRPGSLM